MAPWSSG